MSILVYKDINMLSGFSIENNYFKEIKKLKALSSPYHLDVFTRESINTHFHMIYNQNFTVGGLDMCDMTSQQPLPPLLASSLQFHCATAKGKS